jgi:hypothetical protein
MYPGEAWGKPRDEARLPLPHGNALWTQEIYYHILNSGLRISPSAGSASGVLPNPVGYNRVYVHAGDELSWRGWWDGLRAGRVFVTNGPLLRVTANGALPGHVFSAVENQSVDVDLRVAVDSNDPISAVNVIVNGEVERVVPFKAAQETGGLGKLHFEHSGWFLVTAITEKKDVFRFASTGPYYVEVGASARRISRESAQFFVDWVQERMDRLTLPDDAQRAEVLKPHEQALAFWKDVLERANAD